MPKEKLNYSSVEPPNRKQMELDRVTRFRITFTPFLEGTYRVRVVSARQRAWALICERHDSILLIWRTISTSLHLPNVGLCVRTRFDTNSVL